jgi:hypothetical protein
LMEMVQVRVRGAIRPAKRGPGGTVITTLGVETAGERHHTTSQSSYVLYSGKFSHNAK